MIHVGGVFFFRGSSGPFFDLSEVRFDIFFLLVLNSVVKSGEVLILSPNWSFFIHFPVCFPCARCCAKSKFTQIVQRLSSFNRLFGLRHISLYTLWQVILGLCRVNDCVYALLHRRRAVAKSRRASETTKEIRHTPQALPIAFEIGIFLVSLLLVMAESEQFQFGRACLPRMLGGQIHYISITTKRIYYQHQDEL